MTRPEEERDLHQPLLEATAWRVALTDAGAEATAAFEAWRGDPVNARAWRETSAMWRALELAGAEEQGRTLLAGAKQRMDGRLQRRQAGRRHWAAAAVVLVALGLGVIVPAFGLLEPGRTISTPPQERRATRLPDGSTLTLDARTRVRVQLTPEGREIELLAGQARFDVAPDHDRPFRVHADGMTVTALGTSFSVDRAGGQVAVTLLEGRVAVAQGSGAWPWRDTGRNPHALVAVGQRLSLAASPGAPGVISQVSVGQATAWETGKLVFADEPLSVVVERVSRYSPHKISVGDRAAGAIRLSGVFEAGDSATFIDAVTQYYALDAASGARGEVVLRTRSKK